MADYFTSETEREEDLEPLAIEGNLPLKAVGIENLKEANPYFMPPHRYLYPWFARRPTPASRLAVLASILPQGVDSNTLLDWMQIGPRADVDVDIEEYVENKKATEDDREGNLEEHYGYPRPFTFSPSEDERQKLHNLLRQRWDDELPTVLDPTAGGGVIPFESLRYGLPTVANELNPIPSIILKVLLEHSTRVGSLGDELDHWANKINKSAKDSLEEFFPSESEGQTPSIYIVAHCVECPECGCDIPLTKKWWLQKRSASKGVAVRPSVSDSGKKIEYEVVCLPDDISKSAFNPQQGPHTRGGAQCLNCNVVTESEILQQRLKNGDFEYEVYGVKYEKSDGSTSWRAPTKEDQEAYSKATEYIESDFRLHNLFSTNRYIGDEDRAGPYGVTKWRDAFSPRQLVTHYEYIRAFEEHAPEIRSKYSSDKSKALLTILSLMASKMVDRNSRFSPLDISNGLLGNTLGGKHFTLQWAFCENNAYAGNQSYLDTLDRVRDSYEEIVSYMNPEDADKSRVLNGDAADLELEDKSIQAVVIDPPYYDSIIYSELSDILYVVIKEYLSDVYPHFFSGDLTDKQSEAVANAAEFESIAGDQKSAAKLANEDYESKMSNIFSELHRVLEPGGVMTVMFTHKETDAWDTLTMSLINSGFTITSTHPITSEMPQRTDTRGGGSADSTLLLTGRKRHDSDEEGDFIPSLWNDVKSDTRKAAKEAARNLIESGLSLTKTDIIISAFGPTLRVFANSYPVVDDEDSEIPPRRALEEAREAVTQVLVEEYLEAEGINDLDDISEWYILSWLVHEKEMFSYDEGHQLGLGLGVDIDEIKRSTKTWRKRSGDIGLRGHKDRVQSINAKPENRSSRTPVNPDGLSFSLALDKVHAAMHVYDVQGESACCDWLRERNFDSDSTFKATLKALLQVLPHDHEDWELARDLVVGRTRDVLDLDFSPNVFAEDNQQTQQTGINDY
jgi:adenine-specific DNA methylase